MQVGLKAAYDCVKAFSETDMTEDLKRIDVPVLIVQGDDDQIVPLDDSGRLSAQIVKDATLKIYPGAPHGLANTAAYKDTLNTDLLQPGPQHMQLRLGHDALHAQDVGSARDAVPALRPARFPGPPSAPAVPVPGQRALRKSRWAVGSQAAAPGHGVGILAPRYR